MVFQERQAIQELLATAGFLERQAIQELLAILDSQVSQVILATPVPQATRATRDR